MTGDRVSRETPPRDAAPEPPPAAGQVFGVGLPVARAYVHLLATTGVTHGLIGPRERDRLWDRHVLNCAALAELVPTDSTVLDVGSGAGLPGLVLAIARPDLQVTLVEPLLRRTSWLLGVVAALELDVRVVRARAEELHGQERADVVTSRAVAPLERLARWCLPLVVPGGRMLAIKGAGAQQEVAAAARSVRRLGGLSTDVVRCGMAWADVPTTVVRVVRGPAA